MAFQQAGIEVQNVAEFETLKAGLERAFAPEAVQKYLKALEAKGIRVRDWQAVLDRKMLEKVGALEKGVSAKQLYEALTVSDQGLMREFYLASLEAVDVAWRHKFYRIYASY